METFFGDLPLDLYSLAAIEMLEINRRQTGRGLECYAPSFWPIERALKQVYRLSYDVAANSKHLFFIHPKILA